VTTEHFTHQGARSSTVAEATGRATMFIGAISGGLVALGLIATATGVKEEFYAFGLILPAHAGLRRARHLRPGTAVGDRGPRPP
jgi:hypothetical protein